MTDPLDATARRLLEALDARTRVAPLSDTDPALDLPAAYRLAEAVSRLRRDWGERPVGWRAAPASGRIQPQA